MTTISLLLILLWVDWAQLLVLWLQLDGGWCCDIQEGRAQLHRGTAGLCFPWCFHLVSGVSLAQQPDTQGHIGLLKANAQDWHGLISATLYWQEQVSGQHGISVQAPDTWAAYQAAWFFEGYLWRSTVAPAEEWHVAERTYLKYLSGDLAHSKYSANNSQTETGHIPFRK